MSVSIAARNQGATGQKHQTFGNAPYKAWLAKAPKQPMVLDTIDLGPLGPEEVEVAVESCGVCHSDVSVFNNDWGISQYPAVLGHEVIGRVTAVGPNTKRIQVGQRVGVGWNSGSCMHCRQCMSGNHNLCSQVEMTIVGHRGGLPPLSRS
jgi:alcohol/geraniol dehydrogenase (NADP+)